jgi:hypothetical protein
MRSGSHSDIGGGYKAHDLADITLTWMVANVGDALAMDLKYLARLPQPVAPWGAQPPHNPETGIFALSISTQRTLPTKTDDTTHETIHPSVLHQKDLYPKLAQDIRAHPKLITELLPLEEEMKQNWPFDPSVNLNNHLEKIPGAPEPLHDSWNKIAQGIAKTSSSILHKVAGDM